jgi:hypothetical protein
MKAMGRTSIEMVTGSGASEPWDAEDVRGRVCYSPEGLMEIVLTGNDVPDRAEILCQAIAKRVCVTATYNGQAITLAPHIVFTKYDDQFLGAVTVEQDGKKPKVNKLGTFKLAGLNDLTLTQQPFEPRRSFRADDPQYAGIPLLPPRPGRSSSFDERPLL